MCSHPKFRDELYEYCEKTKWLQRPARAGRSNEVKMAGQARGKI